MTCSLSSCCRVWSDSPISSPSTYPLCSPRQGAGMGAGSGCVRELPDRSAEGVYPRFGVGYDLKVAALVEVGIVEGVAAAVQHRSRRYPSLLQQPRHLVPVSRRGPLRDQRIQPVLVPQPGAEGAEARVVRKGRLPQSRHRRHATPARCARRASPTCRRRGKGSIRGAPSPGAGCRGAPSSCPSSGTRERPLPDAA